VVARLPGQQRDYLIDSALNCGWRHRFASVRKSLKNASQGVALSPFWQVNADDASLGPSDGARADGRIEQREEANSHIGRRC